jgi:hypothetical protein
MSDDTLVLCYTFSLPSHQCACDFPKFPIFYNPLEFLTFGITKKAIGIIFTSPSLTCPQKMSQVDVKCENCGALFDMKLGGATTTEQLQDETWLQQNIDGKQCCSKSCWLARIAKDNKKALAVGAGCVVATPVLLAAVGFTATGVAAGSAAAATQSVVYGAWTGGVFSVLQSAGTGSVMLAPVASAVGTAGAGFTALVGAAFDRVRGQNQNEDGDEKEAEVVTEEEPTDAPEGRW